MSRESIIKAFEGVNVRIVWDDETEEYYFAVNDIVQVLTESVDPKDYIKKMLKRDPELRSRWGTICPPTRMRAADGKMRMTKAATMTNLEMTLNMLAEGTAAEISKQENPQGFGESAGIAQRGGDVAHGARQLIEKELGHSVVSPLNAKDYFNSLEQEDCRQLPEEPEKD